MRLVMTIAALGLAAPMLSGCYALERALWGPGWHDSGHYRNHGGRGYRDGDRDRSRGERRGHRRR
jgi:hypothetical protein